MLHQRAPAPQLALICQLIGNRHDVSAHAVLRAQGHHRLDTHTPVKHLLLGLIECTCKMTCSQAMPEHLIRALQASLTTRGNLRSPAP